MSQKPDFKLPFNSLVQYVPQNLRNDVVTGLLDNLFNRFMTRDESVPFYGYIGRRPIDDQDTTPAVPAATVERDINAVVPVLNFKLGTEDVTFTVQDIINRAQVLGMSADLSWLYSQANNFRPPVDFDKLTNFFSYYWVPSQRAASWNPEALPEYYVIARPQPSDLDKVNVVASTKPGEFYLLTGTGFADQSYTITFASPTTFTVKANAALTGPLGLYIPDPAASNSAAGTSYCVADVTTIDPLADPANTLGFSIGADAEAKIAFTVAGPTGDITLVTFSVRRDPIYDSDGILVGNEEFDAGDSFMLDPTFFSDFYALTFTGSIGVKGKIAGVRALSTLQQIDGVTIKVGDRVLVRHDDSVNGIYVVSEQAWQRADDFAGANIVAGARVFVLQGTSGQQVYVSSLSAGGVSWAAVPGATSSNTNDWQEGNFWVKGTDLAALGLTRSDAVQAVRPIIEYEADLRLNQFVQGGVPTEGSGVRYTQRKTTFNQLPLFDLYRYDGTHANVVSSIFYYVEDLTADLDLDLQKRVKRANNGSGDFLFDHGCWDESGNLLFFKRGSDLATVWHSGYISPQITDIKVSGFGNGSITAISATDLAQPQTWTLIAQDANTFAVSGSKMEPLPTSVATATVGVPYSNTDVSFTINAGVVPFEPGDSIVFTVGNLERPRYVTRLDTGAIADVYGGMEADDIAKRGAWQVPRTFIHNPYNDGRSEVTEGAIYSHCRSVLAAQVTSPVNYSLGGDIKLWSEQQTLLASLLMQREMTPISLIDYAQRQYESGLNAIQDIFTQNVVNYLSAFETPLSEEEVNGFVDYMLELRALDIDSRTVLYDTTAGVVGFPATLPQLRLKSPVEPTYTYDSILGRQVLVHHDGHSSALYEDTQDFRTSFLGSFVSKNVLRSDGEATPAVGSFTSTPPSSPYKGELWMPPGGDIYVFAVDYDTSTAPVGVAAGKLWYNRGGGVLYESDGTTWVPLVNALSGWKIVNFASLLNNCLLNVEKRLFNACAPTMRAYDFSAIENDAAYQEQLKRELFTFSAKAGLDPLGTDYVASDAFTWNYSQATATAPLDTASTPARWFNFLTAHQRAVPGVIATERPEQEPWKLFGFADFNAWWASLAPATRDSYLPAAYPSDLSSALYTNGGNVRVVAATPVTTAGLYHVDGVLLQNGDTVLVTANADPLQNGVWTASSGSWTRPSAGTSTNTFFIVSEGSTRAGTYWVFTSGGAYGTAAIQVRQARLWSDQLWSDLMAARPTLRLSVSPFSDTLLPPYVSVGSPLAPYALTTVIPPGVASPYQFGEGSPVETVWKKSIEYGYAQARALCRFDPLAWLGFCWGFNWVEVGGILYDAFDINQPGHKRFRLHGETVSDVDRSSAVGVSGSGQDITLTYDSYEVDGARHQTFTARDLNGEVVGSVREGVSTTLLGWTILIEDSGVPFRMGDSIKVWSTGVEFTPAATYTWYGFGQIFTNALREASISSDNSYAIQAFRNWDVNMGHRVGGLVSTDDLQVFTDEQTLSPASYRLLIKKNEVARDTWIQALRITVQQYGAADENGIPTADASDWVFRIEGYVPRYTQLRYTQLGTVASGLAFPAVAPVGQRFFRHDLGGLYTFNGTNWDATPDERFVTFNVLTQESTSLTFFHSTEELDEVGTYLPITITGLQNVINFVYGYINWTEKQGWELRSDSEYTIDSETGRSRTWQLYVEKFIDRVYRGLQPGEGAILNPFIESIWLNQPTGLVSSFADRALFDVTSHPAVYDVAGNKYAGTDINIARTNQVSTITGAGPMFAIHAQLDEFEHVFVFNNYVRPSEEIGQLYDPFSGARVVSYKFKGRQSSNGTMRMEFGGHYVVGNEVRRNLQAGADGVNDAYDANLAFQDTKVSKHAFSLLGFNRKDYFSDLDISNKAQFNFWRGLIHSKGTNLSFDAYLNNNRFKDARMDEFWAYKVAEYGDARQQEFPELKLQVADCVQQFTQLQFDSTSPLPLFTQISRFDEKRWFSIDDLDKETFFRAKTVGVYRADVSPGTVVTLPFVADALIFSGNLGPGATTDNLRRLNSRSFEVTGTGELIVTGIGPSPDRYTPITLINYDDQEVVEEISLWNPAAGFHPPEALESINIISNINPAAYNYSTLVEKSNNFDPLRPWGNNEVGRTWFDTRNLAYVPYYDDVIFSNRSERLSRWGALADYATIDVYEWVRSEVPPSEYNATAAERAGSAELTAEERISGEVALGQFYYRDRTWKMYPVAWSRTARLNGGHPSFSTSGSKLLYIAGDVYTLEDGTFAERGVTAGMRIGVWENDAFYPAPRSEAEVITTDYRMLSNGSAPAEVLLFSSATPVATSISLAAAGFTELGQVVVSAEPIEVTQQLSNEGDILGYTYTSFLRFDFALSDTSTRVAVVTEFVTSTAPVAPATPSTVLAAGTLLTFSVAGAELNVEIATSGSVALDALASSVADAIGIFKVHDALQTSSIIPLVAPYDGGTYSNEPEDLGVGVQYGWQAWVVPTQAQLDADGVQPFSNWKPYVGTAVDVQLTSEQLSEAVQLLDTPLTLNDGSTIPRYETSWGEWQLITSDQQQQVALQDGPVEFRRTVNGVPTAFDPVSTQVYVNGITQLKSAYTIENDVLTINNAKAGWIATVIVPGYTPTAAELAFNPEVADNLTVQRQFKLDYEYVEQVTRDADGNPSTAVYYFWVRNKTLPARNKKLSIQAVSKILRDGPSNFVTFQNLLAQDDTLPWRYDAITISGLSYVVAKNDTFKLRFTRDFTLRDDPRDLDLKNTHTEWSLIRPAQRTKVPEKLWAKLVDSAAAQDSAGNDVPALRRVLYDERNGTKTAYGFGPEQTLAPSDLLRSSIAWAIVNTKVMTEVTEGEQPDYIEFIEFEVNLSETDDWDTESQRNAAKVRKAEVVMQQYLSSPELVRATMTKIWSQARVRQINAVFFAALEDILASNFELTDMFKTSRLSIYSIQEKRSVRQPTQYL